MESWKSSYWGNISAINYSFGNNITNGYTYYYDNLNRLSSNYSLLNQQFGDYAYSESFQYDKNGNITHLSRWDNQDTMDHLYLEYDGNQVIGVSDEGFPPYSYDSKQYYDYADSDVEFGYDANGNMTYDLDRNICAIKYNLLNLPDTIQFSNGNLIVHQYDALGNKCFTTYYTRNTPIVVPIGNIVEQLDSAYNVLTYSYNDHFVYKINANNIIKREFVHNSEGYIRYGNDGVNFYPYYYIKDYLGNVRETYVCLTQTSSQCIQRMQYYPSGMPWNDNYQASQQPYKYGGKEFVEMHGLDEYDSEARWYYPALMRTTTQDPLAEKYYDISPYAWCANNPVNLVDPDGKDIYYIGIYGEIMEVEKDNEQEKFVLIQSKKEDIPNTEQSEMVNISFKYGAIDIEYLDLNGQPITAYTMQNQQDAADLFKFFANNLNIEFGLILTTKESFVMTKHSPRKVPVSGFAQSLDIKNYTITNIIHNHPKNTGPSGFKKDPKTGDAGAAISFNKSHGFIIDRYVYKDKSNSLIKYNEYSIEKELQWIYFYNNIINKK